MRRLSSLKPTLLTPNELLDNQIDELQGRVDNLNAELTNVMKTGAEIALSINKLEGNKSNRALTERRKQQLIDNTSQKENLLKRLRALEAQISRKAKEKATATF